MNESSKATESASYACTASEAWNWNESQLAELNRHLDKPFGEVELFNRCLAFALWQSGHPVWVWIDRIHPRWIAVDFPFGNDDMKFRVMPKPEVTVLPSIDWSAVADGFNWMAQDQDGSALLYSIEPNADHDCGWSADHGAVAYTKYFASFKPGTGDWKKLIVQRPEVTK